MADQLFALKRDLDMVIQDLENLKTSYNLLDYIAKVVRDCNLEQLAQAAQMRRMEAQMKEMRTDIDELKTDVAQMKGEIATIKSQLQSIIEQLKLINRHLGIQSA